MRWLIRRRHVKLYRGWFAWELQVGSVVFQFVHAEHLDEPLVRDGEIRRLSVWRVPF